MMTPLPRLTLATDCPLWEVLAIVTFVYVLAFLNFVLPHLFFPNFSRLDFDGMFYAKKFRVFAPIWHNLIKRVLSSELALEAVWW